MQYRLAVIGMGNRAGKYLQWVTAHPETVRLAAVADPDPARLSAAAAAYGLEESACYLSADELFSREREIDAVIIATPDKTHYRYAMTAISLGWHVLLEKPMAGSWEECQAIADAARKADVYVSVCFILRLYPYWQQFHALMHEARFGKVLSVHHEVNAGVDRCVHTFVRGLWSREADSTPLILSKCCHDLDLLTYLCGSEPRKVASFGGLGWFRPENAPEGAAGRCVDCPLEPACAFSAVDLYQRRNKWNLYFDRKPGESLASAVERELREGRYGRCAYHCDNDVVDHQTVLMEMEDGATVSLRLNCLTREDNRVTLVNASGGEIRGDGKRIRVRYFDTGEEKVFDYSADADQPLHAGMDLEIVRDFFGHIASGGRDSLTAASRVLAGHRACFEAEAFRNNTSRLISK